MAAACECHCNQDILYYLMRSVPNEKGNYFKTLVVQGWRTMQYEQAQCKLVDKLTMDCTVDFTQWLRWESKQNFSGKYQNFNSLTQLRGKAKQKQTFFNLNLNLANNS